MEGGSGGGIDGDEEEGAGQIQAYMDTWSDYSDDDGR